MIQLSKTYAALSLYIFLYTATPVQAFGANGHRIIADIAENHLTSTAKKAIMKITGGHPLPNIATWPDEIRSDPNWNHAKAWHFLSIDDNESFNGYKHSEEGDLITALTHFEKALTSQSTSKEKRWQALAFYIHFVGDIHQPLHVGRRDDRGGNSISVQWFNKNTNLHSVWDSEIIEFEQLSYSEYVSFLDHASKAEINNWQNSDYWDWAKESKAHRKAAYNYGKQYSLNLPNLEYTYIFNKKNILNQQLLKGGMRLAGKLNKIFDN